VQHGVEVVETRFFRAPGVSAARVALVLSAEARRPRSAALLWDSPAGALGLGEARSTPVVVVVALTLIARRGV
jgi:hypothetical protein